jgi:hypothetical protein
MFLLDPLEGARPRFTGFQSNMIIGILALAGAYNAASALPNHTRDDLVSAVIPRRAGIDQIIHLMVDNVRADGTRRVHTYAVGHVGWLSAGASMLENCLIYDHAFQRLARGTLARGAVHLQQAAHSTSFATEVEWSTIPGRTDDERVAFVVSQWADQVDFLMVATEDSHLPGHVVSTRLLPKIRAEILAAGHWRQQGEPIKLSSGERVLFLVNEKRRSAR